MTSHEQIEVVEVSEDERSHYSRSPASWVAGASDVGQKHHINQDAMCLAAKESPRSAVLVISDGVTTAARSEIASLHAAETACQLLTQRLSTGGDVPTALDEAFAAAHEAVVAQREGMDVSACTLIVAVVEPGLITVGNVGDCRAYWVSPNGMTHLLSTDDSMAQARIELGMERGEAESSEQAHSITKWLGREASDVTPSICTFETDGDGWLVVCSDGLWNYASAPEDMGQLIAWAAQQAWPEQMCQALVDWANAQGGKDNVTVALARPGYRG